jgi:phosphoribosylamine-glycine ligase
VVDGGEVKVSAERSPETLPWKSMGVDIVVESTGLFTDREKAAKHVVIPDLNIGKICDFAESNKNNIDFALVGPEKPIIEGIRDLMEQRTGIPVICPKQEYAIEASKVQQRLLFQEIAPEEEEGRETNAN